MKYRLKDRELQKKLDEMKASMASEKASAAKNGDPLQ